MVEGQILEKLIELVENLKELTEDVKRGEGTIGKLFSDDTLYENARSAIENFSNLTGDVKNTFSSVQKAGQSVEKAGDRIQLVADNLNVLVDSINHGEGFLALMLRDETLYYDLRQTLQDGRTLMAKVSNAEGSFGKLLNDKGQLYDRLNGSLISARETFDQSQEILARLEKGEGTLGKLINDDDLYNEFLGTIEQVRESVNDFREQIPLATFGSFIFGAL